MLNKKQVGIYTVSQIGALEGARMRLFQKQNAEWYVECIARDIEIDPAVEQARNEWAAVAACTLPHINFDEYISKPYTELRPIVEAMEELNADMVEGLDAVVSKKNNEK